MKFLILALISFPALAMNDWRIECLGVGEPDRLFKASDERIKGDSKNRTIEIVRWGLDERVEWSYIGRVFVSSKDTRKGFFFRNGRLIEYKLDYLSGFRNLPSQETVDLSRANAFIAINHHEGLSRDSRIVKSEVAELACYYREGGE